MARRNTKSSQPKDINLALQGGGAHGAFTWGVLDGLLDDGRIGFEAATSASAGSMNAVVLAHGLTNGGLDGARQALHDFWERVSGASSLVPDHGSALFGMDWTPFFTEMMMDTVSRLSSPYQFNPLNYNPLRNVLEGIVDFERLQTDCAIKLYISATNVRSGKIKVFENNEVTVDSVLASGCLPHIFQAVEIDGEAYWDGGYMGNPPIYPVIYGSTSSDILIVHINPLERPDIPKDASSIMDRVNEISFNSSLMREMRAIAFVTDLIERKQLKGRQLRKMHIHSVEGTDLMRKLGVASKLNPEWSFLKSLRDEGVEAARTWLKAHFKDIGKKSPVAIRETYL
jgi:NTE family protein